MDSQLEKDADNERIVRHYYKGGGVHVSVVDGMLTLSKGSTQLEVGLVSRWLMWRYTKTLIQYVWPEMSPDQREFIRIGELPLEDDTFTIQESDCEYQRST